MGNWKIFLSQKTNFQSWSVKIFHVLPQNICKTNNNTLVNDPDVVCANNNVVCANNNEYVRIFDISEKNTIACNKLQRCIFPKIDIRPDRNWYMEKGLL